MHLHFYLFIFLFAIVSCVHSGFAHKITPCCYFFLFFVSHQLQSFYFIIVFFILCLTSLWLHQLSSVKLDLLICVMRHFFHLQFFHTMFFVYLFVFPTFLTQFSTLFLNACKKVINGFVWLDDRPGLSPIPCDTVTTSVYTDQSFCHFFSFTLILLKTSYLFAQWLFVLFLFISWVIWNNKLFSQLLQNNNFTAELFDDIKR